ncbi:putative DNA-binding protein in cluster with Type I restriction-modification system [Candidatus Burkholderia verschuerenii]|uniref:Putative DNA-binding protein in cluster with Type I restriction-modification system n=1 Tax=Candidatus Burkholderia verschuerenii TaxID=242163 RepID=A0A0L0MA25_9BURK|nr:helix-turn-helix transcriptional regulator [Candidatus Burkholderia verschuerenii]KND59120.1 putative DNA-binding protein in cluster with Type I restriction-modification system [Candidatus Burkholderia verschuerenii]
MRTLDRTRSELADFLRARRERLSPAEVGLPSGGRRRTPGLRREEVAALAGVGITWYTWLEQGHAIGLSVTFLENLARVLRLDAAERRHLFLLAHERLPADPGKTWCLVPPLALRLMHDLAPHLAYVLNLRWDVLPFNAPADQLFGFSAQPPRWRNLLWLLFTDAIIRERIESWEEQAPLMLSSFRRDFARAAQGSDIRELMDELEEVSPEFKTWWHRHDVHAPCTGIRHLVIDGQAEPFEHTSLTIDENRHLRLVVYARQREGTALVDVIKRDGSFA